MWPAQKRGRSFMTTINHGVTSSGLTFSAGNPVTVDSGGTLEASTIDGGINYVLSGGYASANTVDGGFLWLDAGGSSSDTTVSGGLSVVYGGIAYATTVHGGAEDAESGGIASGAQVYAGGKENVSTGGSAVGTDVFNGGGLLVVSGGTAISAAISLGGSLEASPDATVDDTTVHGGGVFGASTQDVIGNVTIDGGAVQAPAETLGGSILFTANGGELALGDTSAMTATISGWASGASIDISGLAYVSGASASLVGNQLTVLDGATSATFTVDPTGLVSSDFAVGNDFLGNTELTFGCFCAGTRIATSSGEAAVEDLRAGDLVLLADGRTLPVRFVGRQTVSRHFADPLRAMPVRIRAGALDGEHPTRDLLVSPGHALLLGGILVQAGALTNLCSVSREHAMPEVFSYYHVELDEHALLLAEGVPAESFLSGVEAVTFDNRAERPARAAAAELPYPRVCAARQLPAALRARFTARAA
jgi:autotransporter passenger strand-loop-strand repeat protein